LGGVGVGPGGDTQGRGSVDDDIGGATGLDDGGVVLGVALEPSLEVGFGGEQVTLFAIAFDVGEDQVVGEIAWVARRGHEMVDVAGADSAAAVHAMPVLCVGERRGHGNQCGSFGAKQEFTEIGCCSEQWGIAG